MSLFPASEGDSRKRLSSQETLSSAFNRGRGLPKSLMCPKVTVSFSHRCSAVSPFSTASIYLHCDVTERPYHSDDFEATFICLNLVNEVLQLGLYQIYHLWMVTFRTTEAKRMLLSVDTLQVKGKHCFILQGSGGLGVGRFGVGRFGARHFGALKCRGVST